MKITFGKHHMASQFGANLHILLFLYVLKHILLIFNLLLLFLHIFFTTEVLFEGTTYQNTMEQWYLLSII